jgi:hypothetical protein
MLIDLTLEQIETIEEGLDLLFQQENGLGDAEAVDKVQGLQHYLADAKGAFT